MFVRRLVSGVRSSCDASETSCRCARAESSSAPSIVLNVAASRESSSVPDASIRRERSRVSDTSSAVLVSRWTGASTAFATTQPERGRERDPDGGDQEQEHSDPVERGVDLLERPRDLEREPRVVDRERVDAEMRAGDARIGEERSMVAGRRLRAPAR